MEEALRPATVIPSLDRASTAANSAAIDRLIPTTRYPYLVAWAKWLGFTPEAVRQGVLEAEKDNAPQDSIQKIDGRWLVLDDIKNDTNRKRVEKIARASQGWSR